jgi:predicted O-linked N-acetylglucosamine transferase (SPINDLY family)
MPALSSQQALDLAIQHHQAGRLVEAESLYRGLLAADPHHACALHLLGRLAQQSGWTQNAAELIRQAIAADPSNGAFYNDLGNVLQQEGRLDEAVDAYRRAIDLAPGFAAPYNNLGNTLAALGHFAEARSAYQQALALTGAVAEIHNNLATTMQKLGDIDAAIAGFRRAIALQPSFAMAHNNLANALLTCRQFEEAIAGFRAALALDPHCALFHNNLANAFREDNQLDAAVDEYRRALECDPNHVLALSNLSAALLSRGEDREAIALGRRAVALPDCTPAIHSSILTSLQYPAEVTLAALLEAHAEYDRRHALPLRNSCQPHTNSRDPGRPLRVGLLSPHFGFHPVGHFLVRSLAHFDRRQFSTVCYLDSARSDAMTARLRAGAAEWHRIDGLSDDALARRIRDDGIDVLFDLAGHTAGNRLLVFARKPAPIQITWLDYVGTTGLSAMDYLLADPREIPPEAERFYREKILRMPDDYITFDPPAAELPVGPLPALANGHVTFANFNVPAKTTETIVEVWSRILQRLPGARMIFSNAAFDTPFTGARYRRLFASHGVDPNRVTFRGWKAHRDLLASYHEIDIVLDTFPYNGGLTSCEALWMGVPVVTCPGETFASRHGLAHLTAAGVTETIARDLDDYADIAAELARDLPRLASLRNSLRSRVESSPLCDGTRFAQNLGSLLREAWHRWCQQA